MAARFLFDPPRRAKPKAGLNVKSLLVRYPSTSKLTDTGRTIEEERWRTARVKTQRFTCAHCGSVHTWTKKDVILGRPTSNEPVIFPKFPRLIFRIPTSRINWTTSSFLIGTFVLTL